LSAALAAPNVRIPTSASKDAFMDCFPPHGSVPDCGECRNAPAGCFNVVELTANVHETAEH
jgi:hypothetical protein